MAIAAPTVSQHFVGKSQSVQAIYTRLLQVVAGFGAFTEDPKQTSIHLNRRTAFVGVATRKSALLLTVKSATDIVSPRIRKHEQASKSRWHLELMPSSPDEVDTELVGWLQAAYGLSA